jgi:hypothetical protein
LKILLQQRSVQVLQQLARTAQMREGPERSACDPGDGGGLDTLAADVTDKDSGAPVRHLEHVIEIAADAMLGLSGQEQRSDLEPVHLRQYGGMQASLEGLGHEVSIRVQPCILQRACDPASNFLRETPVVRILQVDERLLSNEDP